MKWRRSVSFIFAFCVAISVAAPRAYAQAPARIGEAAVIQNQVVNAATTGQINVGVEDGLLMLDWATEYLPRRPDDHRAPWLDPS